MAHLWVMAREALFLLALFPFFFLIAQAAGILRNTVPVMTSCFAPPRSRSACYQCELDILPPDLAHTASASFGRALPGY